MKIFIVIPAYNEEKRIGKVLADIKKYKLPTIVVDDGSNDNTFLIAQKYGAEVLKRRVNLGGSKGAALKTGIEMAFNYGADAVILMDADGQHKASDLPKFIKALEKGFDVVLGNRNFSMDVPLVRFLGNKFASVLINVLFGIYISDVLCGFRALTKEAFEKVRWESLNYAIETEMIVRLSKTKLKYCEVPVETIYHDKVKGVTIIDAINIFFDVIYWKIIL
jgi:glycosyltransferase involved in cell wall biosynthesis